MNDRPFRDQTPLAWSYHRNSMRFAHSTEPLDGDTDPLPARETPDAALINLPDPTTAHVNFFELLSERYSCRQFSVRELELSAVATILHASYGISGRSRIGRLVFYDRPVPSGGGLYPLELTILVSTVKGVEPGFYHYVPVVHGLEHIRESELPKRIRDYLFMGQHQLTTAPVIIIISACFYRSLRKYGDRGYRYILFEAGHVAQNLNLAALALGFGSCNIGGFFDQELGEVMKLDQEMELPLYAVAIGWPRSDNRITNRGLNPEDNERKEIS